MSTSIRTSLLTIPIGLRTGSLAQEHATQIPDSITHPDVVETSRLGRLVDG